MKHFLLKFNHGVEIGARLAYLGHYRVTGDKRIKEIADEELEHKLELMWILRHYGEKPSKVINTFFTIVGYTIYGLCFISPKSLLDKVAQIMEIFAVFNYHTLAKRYIKWSYVLTDMELAEGRHRHYFSNRKVS